GGAKQEGERDADGADDQEETAPAERLRNPEERHAEKTDTGVLPDRIDGIGPRAFALREPRREDTAVGGEARRFKGADADAHGSQPDEALHAAHGRREGRPAKKRDEVRRARAEAIERDAAGNLEQRVTPREGGKRDAHHRGSQPEIFGETRRR